MELTALLLSRLQFAFTISFHIIFPSFTIGLAVWRTILEALYLGTRRPVFRRVFEFWLKIFGVAFGLGVVSGVVMAFQFGTNWSVLSRMSGPIAYKCEREVRDKAYGLIRTLSLGLLTFLIVVFAFALSEKLAVMERWSTRPYLFVFPLTGTIAALVLAVSVKRRWDVAPFFMVAAIFVTAFGTLGVSFYPYMIPFSITIDEAAAPHSSLAFMFWGAGLFVFPLMLIYVVFNYRVFRGKIRSSADGY